MADIQLGSTYASVPSHCLMKIPVIILGVNHNWIHKKNIHKFLPFFPALSYTWKILNFCEISLSFKQ